MTDKYGDSRNSAFGAIDWWTVLIYLLLVLMGWVSIYAAVFNEEHASMFDISQKYGSQIIWIGICVFLAVSILLIDAKYYHYFAYPFYAIMIVVLLGVLVFGTEVNGARSWFQIGPFRLQPAEFAKFTTALALAKYMSSYDFSIHDWRKVAGMLAIMGIPMLIVLAQNDTGSALVYTSFLFMLYREGFNKWVYVVLGMIVFLFVFSFLLEPETLLFLILFAVVIGEGLTNGFWREKVVYLAVVALVWLLELLFYALFFDGHADTYLSLVIAVVLSLPLVFVYAFRYQLRNIWLFFGLFFGALLFSLSVDYVFNDLMQVHQQKRILDLLGLESDVKGWGYNVNQSKIAIGSGGLFGKGFLQGTQTKYDFVPEQSTDFIFCTIGEEWGFVGSALVVALFTVLIFRLMRMGDRQQDAFGRVYCYGVASIFAFHVLVNIGMTIGIVPVIGIPLPFFSYGGSSLLAFTILLFVALRLDSARQESSSL